MVKDHSDSEKGNPLPPHRLLLSISSKVFFYMHHPTDRIAHTTAFVTPVVDFQIHWPCGKENVLRISEHLKKVFVGNILIHTPPILNFRIRVRFMIRFRVWVMVKNRVRVGMVLGLVCSSLHQYSGQYFICI